MSDKGPDKERFLLPPAAVTWIILALLLASLWPNSPLVFNQLSLYLTALLFIAAIFPYMRRLSLRVPGGSIDWEKEIQHVAVMLKTSLDQTEETGQPTDLQNLLFELWCRGLLSRWLLFLYHYLHEEGGLDAEKAKTLYDLMREVNKDAFHSHT